jgi:hypothetical protein
MPSPDRFADVCGVSVGSGESRFPIAARSRARSKMRAIAAA